MAEYDTEWNISGASVGSIVTLSKTERQVLRVGDTAAVFGAKQCLAITFTNDDGTPVAFTVTVATTNAGHAACSIPVLAPAAATSMNFTISMAVL